MPSRARTWASTWAPWGSSCTACRNSASPACASPLAIYFRPRSACSSAAVELCGRAPKKSGAARNIRIKPQARKCSEHKSEAKLAVPRAVVLVADYAERVAAERRIRHAESWMIESVEEFSTDLEEHP